jgi:hypothetical protein
MLRVMRRKHSVVIGQRVDASKLSLAKKFRREMMPAEVTLLVIEVDGEVRSALRQIAAIGHGSPFPIGKGDRG